MFITLCVGSRHEFPFLFYFVELGLGRIPLPPRFVGGGGLCHGTLRALRPGERAAVYPGCHLWLCQGKGRCCPCIWVVTADWSGSVGRGSFIQVLRLRGRDRSGVKMCVSFTAVSPVPRTACHPAWDSEID